MQLALYYQKTCPYCQYVLEIFDALDLSIELREVSENADFLEELIKQGGMRQVPCLKVTEPSGETSWVYESEDIRNLLLALNKQYAA